MSIGIERLRGELVQGLGPLRDGDGAKAGNGAAPGGNGGNGGNGHAAVDGHAASAPTIPAREAGAFRERLETWEDLLTLVVDPESPKVEDRARKRKMLSYLIERAGLDEAAFWKMGRGPRGRLFLSRYSRVSREIARLEITSFDLDKLLKERYRQ